MANNRASASPPQDEHATDCEGKMPLPLDKCDAAENEWDVLEGGQMRPLGKTTHATKLSELLSKGDKTHADRESFFHLVKFTFTNISADGIELPLRIRRYPSIVMRLAPRPWVWEWYCPTEQAWTEFGVKAAKGLNEHTARLATEAIGVPASMHTAEIEACPNETR